MEALKVMERKEKKEAYKYLKGKKHKVVNEPTISQLYDICKEGLKGASSYDE